MGFLSSTDLATLKASQWQRNYSMVRKSAELLMIVEAANNNWFDQTQGTGNNFLRRLGARHGRRTRDGLNAWTNMVFFDAHVALYATEPFEFPQNQMDRQVKEVIFYVNKQ